MSISISEIVSNYSDTSKVAAPVYNALSLVFPALPGWVAERRAEGLINACKRVQCKLDSAGIPAEQVRHCSLKLGIPWVEGVSVEEDDETLQDIWATLMSNILNPNFPLELARTAYISIIKDFAPVDGKVLFHFYQHPVEEYRSTEFVSKALGIDMEYAEVSIQNLMRLGLLSKLVKNPSVYVGGFASLGFSEAHLTSLGVSFITACLKETGNNKSPDNKSTGSPS